MHNVRSHVGDTVAESVVFAYPEIIQLMDDDIDSLIGFMLIVTIPDVQRKTGTSPFLRAPTPVGFIVVSDESQCQVKLHHPVTLLIQTLDYIEVSRHQVDEKVTLDQLSLKLTELKILSYMI